MSVRVRGLWRGASSLLVCAAFWAGAAAEVRVSEAGGGRLTVVAHDATLGQVLDALRAVRPLRVHASGELTRPVSGTYSGTLPRVLSRILDGYDHVVHLSATGVDLDVLVAAPGERANTPGGGTVAVVRNVGHQVSSNVDRDEETATAGARPPAVRTPPPAAPAQSAVFTGIAAEPIDARRVSSNVDLDEEKMSR
jgi:hypothetical protein